VLSRPRFVTDRAVARFLQQLEEWIVRETERMKQVTARPSRMRGSRTDYLARKEHARALAGRRLAYWSECTGITHGRVSIKNMATRWGSCSAKGNLNFHYKILDLPQDLLDYLIVHELCHVREMNHGARFWALVAQHIPLWKSCRRRLRAEF
jgi:predicted metal-dependent hydrolase